MNHAGIHSWNQPVLSNAGSFLLKETMGFELPIDQLQVRCSTYCAVLLFQTVLTINKVESSLLKLCY